MARLNYGDFATLWKALSPFNRNPEISDDIQQTMPRLLAWDDVNLLWRPVLVNINGALKTVPDSGSGRYQTISHLSVDATSKIILAENEDRLSFLIQNVGITKIYIGLDSTVSTANGWLLEPGSVYGDDLVIDDIYAISDVAGGEIARIEIEAMLG